MKTAKIFLIIIGIMIAIMSLTIQDIYDLFCLAGIIIVVLVIFPINKD